MRWSSCGLLLLGALGFSIGVFDHELWTPDEPRVAEIAREIGQFRSPFVLTLNGAPFVEKPPLYYWCVRACYQAFGVTASAARLPSLLFTLGTGGFAFLLARRLFGAASGIAAFFLVSYSSYGFYAGHQSICDPALSCAAAGAVFFLHRALHCQGTARPWSWIGFYGLCGVGFWTKGSIGIAFPLITMIGTVLVERRVRELFRPVHVCGTLLVAGAAAAWLLALWVDDPTGTLLREFVWDQNLGRIAPLGDQPRGHREASVLYYLPQVLLAFFPASLFLIHAARFHWTRRANHREWVIPTVWFGLGFLLLSSVGTKRTLYLLPLLPPLAILIAPWLVAVMRDEERACGGRLFVWAGVILAAIGAIVSPVAATFLSGASVRTLLAIGGGFTASGWALTTMARAHSSSRPAALATLLIAAFSCGLGAWIPYIDARKSMKPFAERLLADVSREERLILFRPDETVRAIVPFYTGRHDEEIDELDTLLDVLDAASQTIWVVFVFKSRNALLNSDFVPIDSLRRAPLAARDTTAAGGTPGHRDSKPLLRVVERVQVGPRRVLVLARHT